VGTVRVVTWNIQRGKRDGGEPDHAALVATCAGFGADVLALQEVHRAEPGGPGDVLLAIAEATGLTPLDGHAIEVRGGTYGNALLVRGEADEVVRHRLPASADARELRSLVRCRWRGLRVGCCHLDHRGEAATQLGAALARLGGDGPAVLLGDLNLRLAAVGPVLAAVAPAWAALEVPEAFPARRPDRAIDHVLLRGVRAAGPASSPARPPVSDHRPVALDLAWPHP
jgi:endonuclease/exonuclease/phosphatase family metal-dependent hydrolase